jgi:hypothetical protein
MNETDRERQRLQPPDLRKFLDRLDEIKVFEALVNDECLDKDDTLIHEGTWRVCRIDFSEAFEPAPDLSEACPINRCSRRLYDRLQKTIRQVVEEKLKPYLRDDEINALCERKKRIVARIQQLIKEKGEKAVLF